MSLYVRVVNGVVTDCWDTPPSDGVENNGWMNAVEVRPSIVQNRQGYTAHIFDVSKNPVEIKYGTFNISVSDRKNTMIDHATSDFQQVSNQQTRNPLGYDVTVVSNALATMQSKTAMINVATTHNQLDAIQNGTATTIAEVEAITTADETLTTVTV